MNVVLEHVVPLVAIVISKHELDCKSNGVTQTLEANEWGRDAAQQDAKKNVPTRSADEGPSQSSHITVVFQKGSVGNNTPWVPVLSMV